MKKFYAVLFALLTLVCFATVSMATDMIVEKQIKQIIFKKDKNGAEYARLIVGTTKTLDGVSYSKDTSMMGFGDIVKELKTYKKGQNIKAVVAENQFRGGISYNILKVLK